MTFRDFIRKYNGRQVDFDGAFGAQCVDLFRQYAKECLGITEHTGACATSGGAKDLFLDYEGMPAEKKYFQKITGKSFEAGDVAVWDGNEGNAYGHVAIVIGQFGDDLIVFEQDGCRRDGAKINLRGRERLLGFLRRRPGRMPHGEI